MYEDLTTWINRELQSDDLNRRLAAHLLDHAFDMDWIGMTVEDCGGEDNLLEIAEEIKKSEFIRPLLQRIYGEE